jgi:ribonuclease BN (tRNA processing enzyme)
MRLEILGCSGGIGGERRTTSLLLDGKALVDAGSGVGDLTLEQMVAIDTLFLTHSHLDHTAFLPLLADAAGNFRKTSLKVYALPETIAALKRNFFNGEIWPDYTSQSTPQRPYIAFEPLRLGEHVAFDGGRVTALPACHAVPALAYHMDGGAASFVFSGDTTFCEDFWQAVNGIDNLRYLMLEATFLNDNVAGAARSGHHTAELLARGLRLLHRPAQILITHIESGRERQTMAEVLEAAGAHHPILLQRGQVFEF